MKRALLAASLVAAHLVAAAPAFAADGAFPNRPIRVIVVSPPGGSPDIIMRIVTQKLTESVGQQVIVDNRSGAGGIIGTEIAARATPDGYTLVVGFIGSFAVSPNLHAKLAYDPIRDFQPITLVTKLPNALAVSPSLPVTSVRQLIDLAKAKPGSLNYGSAGNGSAAHLSTEYFKLLTGIDIRHVAYRGTGAALVSLLGGEVMMIITGVPPLMPHIKSGKLRPLGVSTAQRLAQLPDVPTIIEAGVPGYEVVQWYGLLAPARTPDAIVTRVHAEVVKALERPEVRERFSAEGAEPIGSTPAQFAAFIKSELVRWRPVVKAFSTRAE
jgi:tripartite-type tricarboxylate transporter receptor subunit TctC